MKIKTQFDTFTCVFCSQYFIIFVDDFSRITYLDLMKDHFELYSIFKSFYMEIKAQFDTFICVFHSNNSREYYLCELS